MLPPGGGHQPYGVPAAAQVSLPAAKVRGTQILEFYLRPNADSGYKTKTTGLAGGFLKPSKKGKITPAGRKGVCGKPREGVPHCFNTKVFKTFECSENLFRLSKILFWQSAKTTGLAGGFLCAVYR